MQLKKPLDAVLLWGVCQEVPANILSLAGESKTHVIVFSGYIDVFIVIGDYQDHFRATTRPPYKSNLSRCTIATYRSQSGGG